MIRGSISAKLNVLIVMIILIVAGLLMIISNRAYRRAVFRPLERKLNNLAVAEDVFAPVSNHFSKVFQTDEFQEAKTRSKSGDGHGEKYPDLRASASSPAGRGGEEV